ATLQIVPLEKPNTPLPHGPKSHLPPAGAKPINSAILMGLTGMLLGTPRVSPSSGPLPVLLGGTGGPAILFSILTSRKCGCPILRGASFAERRVGIHAVTVTTT